MPKLSNNIRLEIIFRHAKIQKIDLPCTLTGEMLQRISKTRKTTGETKAPQR